MTADQCCGYDECHCLSGHHHVVASLARECDEKTSAPRVVAA